MSDNETLADIIAEMRNRAARREISPEVYGLADRIEAAWNRDAAIHFMTCEANERLREHLAIALESKPSNSKPGHAAAMREALEAFVQLADDGMIQPRAKGHHDEHCFVVAQGMARAALAAPPRNCDRFNTASEAHIAFQRFCRGNYRQGLAASGLDGCDDCELCETKNMSGEDSCPFFWLFGTGGGAE